MRRTWIKLFVDQTLRGTCFKELEPDERFVWFGFLLLAGDNAEEGKICVSEGVGYTDEQIAGLLKISVDLLARAKAKCAEFDKVRILAGNVIEICNWRKYQSEYSRQKAYRQRAKTAPEEKGEDQEGEGEGEGEQFVTPPRNKKLQCKVTVQSYKEGTPEEVDKTGLLPIPKGLPFDVQDELIKRRGEIGRLTRMIKAGYKHDGPSQLTPEILEQHKKAFNERLRDFVP